MASFFKHFKRYDTRAYEHVLYPHFRTTSKGCQATEVNDIVSQVNYTTWFTFQNYTLQGFFSSKYEDTRTNNNVTELYNPMHYVRIGSFHALQNCSDAGIFSLMFFFSVLSTTFHSMNSYWQVTVTKLRQADEKDHWSKSLVVRIVCPLRAAVDSLGNNQ